MWHHPGRHKYNSKEEQKKFAEELKQRTRWHTAKSCRQSMAQKPHLKHRQLLFQGCPTFASYWEDPPPKPHHLPMPNPRRTGTRLCAMIRAGSLPLQVCSQASRYRRNNQESDLCPVCYSADETPEHFLLECPLYDDIRQQYPNRQQDANQVLDFKGGKELDMMTQMWSRRKKFLEADDQCIN